jgi:hypothetical protein
MVAWDADQGFGEELGRNLFRRFQERPSDQGRNLESRAKRALDYPHPRLWRDLSRNKAGEAGTRGRGTRHPNPTLTFDPLPCRQGEGMRVGEGYRLREGSEQIAMKISCLILR